MKTYQEQYEYDNEDRMLYFWLGAESSRVQWYCDNYTGISLKCHLAMKNMGPINQIVFPSKS